MATRIFFDGEEIVPLSEDQRALLQFAVDLTVSGQFIADWGEKRMMIAYAAYIVREKEVQLRNISGRIDDAEIQLNIRKYLGEKDFEEIRLTMMLNNVDSIEPFSAGEREEMEEVLGPLIKILKESISFDHDMKYIYLYNDVYNVDTQNLPNDKIRKYQHLLPTFSSAYNELIVDIRKAEQEGWESYRTKKIVDIGSKLIKQFKNKTELIEEEIDELESQYNKVPTFEQTGHVFESLKVAANREREENYTQWIQETKNFVIMLFKNRATLITEEDNLDNLKNSFWQRMNDDKEQFQSLEKLNSYVAARIDEVVRQKERDRIEEEGRKRIKEEKQKRDMEQKIEQEKEVAVQRQQEMRKDDAERLRQKQEMVKAEGVAMAKRKKEQRTQEQAVLEAKKAEKARREELKEQQYQQERKMEEERRTIIAEQAIEERRLVQEEAKNEERRLKEEKQQMKERKEVALKKAEEVRATYQRTQVESLKQETERLTVYQEKESIEKAALQKIVADNADDEKREDLNHVIDIFQITKATSHLQNTIESDWAANKLVRDMVYNKLPLDQMIIAKSAHLLQRAKQQGLTEQTNQLSLLFQLQNNLTIAKQENDATGAKTIIELKKAELESGADLDKGNAKVNILLQEEEQVEQRVEQEVAKIHQTEHERRQEPQLETGSGLGLGLRLRLGSEPESEPEPALDPNSAIQRARRQGETMTRDLQKRRKQVLQGVMENEQRHEKLNRDLWEGIKLEEQRQRDEAVQDQEILTRTAEAISTHKGLLPQPQPMTQRTLTLVEQTATKFDVYSKAHLVETQPQLFSESYPSQLDHLKAVPPLLAQATGASPQKREQLLAQASDSLSQAQRINLARKQVINEQSQILKTRVFNDITAILKGSQREPAHPLTRNTVADIQTIAAAAAATTTGSDPKIIIPPSSKLPQIKMVDLMIDQFDAAEAEEEEKDLETSVVTEKTGLCAQKLVNALGITKSYWARLNAISFVLLQSITKMGNSFYPDLPQLNNVYNLGRYNLSDSKNGGHTCAFLNVDHQGNEPYMRASCIESGQMALGSDYKTFYVASGAKWVQLKGDTSMDAATARLRDQIIEDQKSKEVEIKKLFKVIFGEVQTEQNPWVRPRVAKVKRVE